MICTMGDAHPNRAGLGHSSRQHHLKSTRLHTPKSYAVFTNCSPRTADVLWLNWQGVRVNYTANGLKPGTQLRMNTFVGHPWIFRDHLTGNKLFFAISTSCDMKEVFFPVANAEENDDHKRPTEVNIRLPVYTLKQRSLQVVRSLVKDTSDFRRLDIPVLLRTELANPEDIVEW